MPNQKTCFKVLVSNVTDFSYIYNGVLGVCLTKDFEVVKVTTFAGIRAVNGNFDTEDEAEQFLDIYNNCNNLEKVKGYLCGQF